MSFKYFKFLITVAYNIFAASLKYVNLNVICSIFMIKIKKFDSQNLNHNM